MATVKVLMALTLILLATGGGDCGAPPETKEEHHVVGGYPNSDLALWSSSRVFRVGDKIWFTYSIAKENMVELKSKEEYEACDVSNPIRMFTDGLDAVPLEEEGIRYFASGKPESCKNGLKLNVNVQSQSKLNPQNPETSKASTAAAANGPTTPSASAQLNGLSFGLFVGLLFSYFVM